MANRTFSSLLAASTLQGDEIVPITQYGADKKTTTQDIADLASSGGNGTIPVTEIAASTSGGTGGARAITIDASTDAYYVVNLDDNIASITITPPPQSEATKVVVMFTGTVGSNTIAWPADWVWANGVAPFTDGTLFNAEWSMAYVKLNVMGTAADPLVGAELQPNIPQYPPYRVRNDLAQWSIDTGVLTLDLSSGDIFWVDLNENVTSMKFINIPGGKIDGSFVEWGRPVEIDIIFSQAADPWTFTVALPDGSWENGVKYVVPTGQNARCQVHMLAYGSEDPNDTYAYCEMAYGRPLGEVNS